MKQLKLKELELIIQSIPFFRNPDVKLEQYATPSTLAARILWIAETVYGDIHGKAVLDLGSGTGRLGLGASYMGAQISVLIDIDESAIAEAKKSAEKLGIRGGVDLVLADARFLPLREKSFDTVIENPPFGVHRRGADIDFLRSAARVGGIIYTIHKKSTLSYVKRRAGEFGCRYAKRIYEDKICIPYMFSFHRKRLHCVDIVVLRLVCQGI